MSLAVETQQAPPVGNQTDDVADLGIIQPPPELKPIIDRTAEFVAKNGPNFEAKILANERDNPRFAFLRPGNPFYAYYQFKIRAFRKKEGIPDPNDKAAIIKAAEEKLKLKKTLLGEIDEEEEERKRKEEQKALKEKLAQAQKDQGPVEAPPPEEWILEPPYVTPLDIDVIKLSAQFIARNGKPFQFGLLNREAKNPQFGFLQENHPLHPYFRQLVECYTRVILPPKDTIENLEKIINNKSAILERVMKKVRWEKAQIKTEEQKKAEEEKERVLMASIDWHDFVVVETIDFDEDEKLPAPLSDPTKLGKAAEDQIAEVEMETDMEIEKPTAATKTPSEPTPEPLPPEPTKVIGPEYKRRPPKPGEDLRAVRYQICPKCGQEIPVDEMAEHMKIELSGLRLGDRKTKEEREAAVAEGSEIEENLRRLAEKRTDIFGTHEEEDLEIGKGRTEDKNRYKVTWDGHTGSIARTTLEARQGMSLQEQIAAIHAAKGLTKPTTEKTIGPQVEPPTTSSAAATTTTTTTTTTASSGPSAPASTATPSAAAPSAPAPTPAAAPPRPPTLPSVPPRVVPPFAPFPAMMGYPPLPGMPPLPPYVPPAYPPMTTQQQPAGHERPPNPEEEPPVKRQKTEEGGEKEEAEKVTAQLLPEAEWRSRISGPVTVKVSVPSVPEKTEWKLHGQIIEVEANISDTVRHLKEKIQEILSMPVNKQKLKARDLGVLNDQKTLAYYNFTQTMEIELAIKERGGRKK